MMEFTASKTASWTIAPQRFWTTALVGATDTVACMISFQSVTVSARAADGPKAPAINIPASINGNGFLCLAPAAMSSVFIVAWFSVCGGGRHRRGAQTMRGDAGRRGLASRWNRRLCCFAGQAPA
jgi:hypothetical protein